MEKNKTELSLNKNFTFSTKFGISSPTFSWGFLFVGWWVDLMNYERYNMQGECATIDVTIPIHPNASNKMAGYRKCN